MEFIAGLTGIWLGAFFGVLLLIALIVGARSYFWGAVALGGIIFVSEYTSVQAFTWSLANWATLATYFGGYLVIGFAWVIFAYYMKLRDVRSRYALARSVYLAEFLKVKGLQKLEDAHLEEFRQYLRANGSAAIEKEMTITKSFVADQVVLWPFKVFGFFFTDMIKFLSEKFMELFGGMFGRMRRAMFKDFAELN